MDLDENNRNQWCDPSEEQCSVPNLDHYSHFTKDHFDFGAVSKDIASVKFEKNTQQPSLPHFEDWHHPKSVNQRLNIQNNVSFLDTYGSSYFSLPTPVTMEPNMLNGDLSGIEPNYGTSRESINDNTFLKNFYDLSGHDYAAPYSRQMSSGGSYDSLTAPTTPTDLITSLPETDYENSSEVKNNFDHFSFEDLNIQSPPMISPVSENSFNSSSHPNETNKISYELLLSSADGSCQDIVHFDSSALSSTSSAAAVPNENKTQLDFSVGDMGQSYIPPEFVDIDTAELNCTTTPCGGGCGCDGEMPITTSGASQQSDSDDVYVDVLWYVVGNEENGEKFYIFFDDESDQSFLPTAMEEVETTVNQEIEYDQTLYNSHNLATPHDCQTISDSNTVSLPAIPNVSQENDELLDMITEVINEMGSQPIQLPQKPTKEEIEAERNVRQAWFQCIACDKTFKTRASLKKHFHCNQHHDSVQVKTLPDPAFDTKTWLIHPVTCPACDEQFQYYYQCVQHIYAKHK